MALFEVGRDSGTRRLQLRGQASLSITITQVPGGPGEPDQFVLRMILIQPQPGRRPRKTVLSTRKAPDEEAVWMCLRDLASDRLIALGQLEPPAIEEI